MENSRNYRYRLLTGLHWDHIQVPSDPNRSTRIPDSSVRLPGTDGSSRAGIHLRAGRQLVPPPLQEHARTEAAEAVVVLVDHAGRGVGYALEMRKFGSHASSAREFVEKSKEDKMHGRVDNSFGHSRFLIYGQRWTLFHEAKMPLKPASLSCLQVGSGYPLEASDFGEAQLPPVLKLQRRSRIKFPTATSRILVYEARVAVGYSDVKIRVGGICRNGGLVLNMLSGKKRPDVDVVRNQRIWRAKEPRLERVVLERFYGRFDDGQAVVFVKWHIQLASMGDLTGDPYHTLHGFGNSTIGQSVRLRAAGLKMFDGYMFEGTNNFSKEGVSGGRFADSDPENTHF
ncbi:hypothetical protein B0H17DRAFT_1124799 [Mycena rosella]|uniref:Uncharacterized protein n=1 Tax=Mycena rosella TaxID=1033263 RepID=A0AAD7GZY7_MYCRO|nr:hypothetical protein B0H17DRAFT_1124799 [Mycena rosella]